MYDDIDDFDEDLYIRHCPNLEEIEEGCRKARQNQPRLCQGEVAGGVEIPVIKSTDPVASGTGRRKRGTKEGA